MSGVIALVTKDGSVRQVAGDIAFPNGMAITPDNKTLIIAESYGRKLTAFDVDADGNLSNRRVWADLGTGLPDGICIDAEHSVWYAEVPNKCCVRVREGGEVLQKVRVDRGCFACMLGGSDRRNIVHRRHGVARDGQNRKSREIGPDRYFRSQLLHQAPGGREVGLIETPTTWRILCRN